ncbi:MAG: hypothetical protein PHS41_11630 [Victivallaceae bacterium]|nr:hypothetical protein [Victivallaceae bacterium]
MLNSNSSTHTAPPLPTGRFTVGCNYWSSNSGCHMWHDWDKDCVAADFDRMTEAGIRTVRIFPLWPDFQPLHVLRGQGNRPHSYAWKDDAPLPADGSTVAPEMLLRFRYVCDQAQAHGMGVIVALVTGWMSGRLFVPPGLECADLFSDPDAIYFQTRLVSEIVTALKDHPAIQIWEPGNECNCMSVAPNRATARFWLSCIVNAIRIADPGRPVAAGMHGLLPAAPETIDPKGAPWVISDVGNLCDFLTTHPYPAFTQFASTDPIGSFKNRFHATAESLFYADLSGKPCFAEELGTLAPVVAGEECAAEYLRGTLANLYAHDCRSMLWWCAFDQLHLQKPPYRWCAVERELGLFRNDGSSKAVGKVMAEFDRKIASLPVKKLPRFRTDAVVILTTTPESWAAAWGSFLLAKQAGFDVEFRFSGQPLPERDLYIVPSVAGLNGISPELHQALTERAAAGATVLVSYDDAMLAPFNGAFGLKSNGRCDYSGRTQVAIEETILAFDYRCRLKLESLSAEVLLRDEAGEAVFTRNHFGSGEIYFFALPLEKMVVSTSGATECAYWKIYRQVAAKVVTSRLLRSENPQISLTIHPDGENHAWAVAVNNAGAPQKCNFAGTWQIAGKVPDKLAPGDFQLLELTKRNQSDNTAKRSVKSRPQSTKKQKREVR